MGILRSSSLAALMMPCAMTSQRMIPPKMFTKIAFTCKRMLLIRITKIFFINDFLISDNSITKVNIVSIDAIRIIRTFFSSAVMILNASVTCSTVAPPPTSRKLAGSPPCSLMMSIVAIARPAPFTANDKIIYIIICKGLWNIVTSENHEILS